MRARSTPDSSQSKIFFVLVYEHGRASYSINYASLLVTT